MDFKQLEAFLAVANLGSFSHAGKRLFLTQPTISAHIRSLEKELGVQLIVRTAKKAYPTEQGRQLYRYAQSILRLRDEAFATIAGGETAHSETVTIAASTIPAQYILPQRMAVLRRKHPQFVFDVTRCDSAAVVNRVETGEADIGVTGTLISGTGCIFSAFAQDTLIVVTPNTERYRKLAASPFPTERLLKEPFIQRRAGSGTRREYECFLERIGINSKNLQVVAEMEDSEAIKQSVSQGLGISIISERAAEDFKRFGLVLTFPLAEGGICRSLYLVHKKNAVLSARVQEFIALVLHDTETQEESDEAD